MARTTARDEDVLRLLTDGEMEVLGLLPRASNYAFLARVRLGEAETYAVYKPREGEAPLWDFPDGLLVDIRRVASELRDGPLCTELSRSSTARRSRPPPGARSGSPRGSGSRIPDRDGRIPGRRCDLTLVVATTFFSRDHEATATVRGLPGGAPRRGVPDAARDGRPAGRGGLLPGDVPVGAPRVPTACARREPPRVGAADRDEQGVRSPAREEARRHSRGRR